MPGPLPDPNARRRNAPTIPTTNLPASGRHGPVPKVPKWVELGAAGKGWWAWAWKTPQAAGWSDGNIPMVAQRASLEDDLASLAEVEGLDFADVDPTGNTAELRRTVQRVAALATGKLAILKECRELDDRLGLTPKGMAALRWTIVDDKPEEKAKPAASSDRRLRAVDPVAS